MKQRTIGFDVARALAIFGMVIVNFKLAMGATTGSAVLVQFSALFEGRASALFVILAGVGVTFLTNAARVSSDLSVIARARWLLVKRALLLIVLGLAYVPIWEADILHFYGFYFLIATMVFTVNDRGLLWVSAAIMLLFPVLMLLFDYGQNWNWQTLTYQNFWSIDGMVRHILFNGFHPVFPWAAFLTFGMWLGRLDFSQTPVRKSLVVWSLGVLVVTEVMFYFLRDSLGQGATTVLHREEVAFLLSTSIIPPLPQYLLSASSSAVVVLVACVVVSERYAQSRITQWLYVTGQLSLTLYVAHVVLGMGVLEVLGRLEGQSIEVSLLASLVFCLFGVGFSVAWLKFFRSGPLEWVFRKLAS
ncbi:MAG: DUF418 domain-containing protein [Gammaproteobacteria bacterium]|nr:DUF418 domain-containing protein [Gammaproteobacteria bacterium]